MYALYDATRDVMLYSRGMRVIKAQGSCPLKVVHNSCKYLLWKLIAVLVAKYNAGILKLNTSVGQFGRTRCNHLQHDLVHLIKSLFNHLHKACLPLVA